MTLTQREQPMEQAQAALRDSQPPRANLFCQEGVEIVDEIKHKPIPVWRIVAAFVLAAALAVVTISIARAAEAERPHEIVLLLKPYELAGESEASIAKRRNTFTLSGAFPDKAACTKAKQRLVVKVAGTVQCLPKSN